MTKQITITRAYDELAAKGHELLGGLPFDLETMQARYRIRLASGAEIIATPADIAALLDK